MSRILILDPSEHVGLFLSKLFDSKGHTTMYSPDTLDAYDFRRKVSLFNPDLILMEVVHKETSGFNFCRKITRDGFAVVFLSSSYSDEYLQMGFEAGALDYIQKPFTPDSLVTRVEWIIRSNCFNTKTSNIIYFDKETKTVDICGNRFILGKNQFTIFYKLVNSKEKYIRTSTFLKDLGFECYEYARLYDTMNRLRETIIKKTGHDLIIFDGKSKGFCINETSVRALENAHCEIKTA